MLLIAKCLLQSKQISQATMSLNVKHLCHTKSLVTFARLCILSKKQLHGKRNLENMFIVLNIHKCLIANLVQQLIIACIFQNCLSMDISILVFA